MIKKIGYNITTEHGKIDVEIDNGIDKPGMTVSALGKDVLYVYFDNLTGHLVVKPSISDEGIEYVYELEDNIINKEPSINGLTLNAELGEMRVLPVSDEAFHGVSIHALGLLVGQVEFNEIDKALNVYVWDEDSDEFTAKYSHEMLMMV